MTNSNCASEANQCVITVSPIASATKALRQQAVHEALAAADANYKKKAEHVDKLQRELAWSKTNAEIVFKNHQKACKIRDANRDLSKALKGDLERERAQHKLTAKKLDDAERQLRVTGRHLSSTLERLSAWEIWEGWVLSTADSSFLKQLHSFDRRPRRAPDHCWGGGQ